MAQLNDYISLPTQFGLEILKLLAQCGVFCDHVLEHARAVMVNNGGQRRRSNSIHGKHTDNTTFVITRAQYVQCMNVGNATLVSYAKRTED